MGLPEGEDLHDFRVAIRKILAVTSLCSKIFGFDFDRQLKEEIKRLFRATSQKRDLDEFLKFAGLSMESTGLLGTIRLATEEHEREIKRALKDANFAPAVGRECYRLQKILRQDADLVDGFAKKAVEYVVKQLSKSARSYRAMREADHVDLELLHTIRKKCKQFRYQLDFIFLDENEGSTACKLVQEKLGRINDLRMWCAMIESEESTEESLLRLTAWLKERIGLETESFWQTGDMIFSVENCDELARSLLMRAEKLQHIR